MQQTKVFDNINDKVIDDLRVRLQQGSKLNIAAASFSIYAYEALKDELENIDELRFIFTEPTFGGDNTSKQKREFYIPRLNRERNLYGSDFEIRLRNQLSQKAIARECADWIRRKVKFKTNVSQSTISNFMLVDNGVNSDDSLVYIPFNDFTTTELGCERGNSVFTTIVGTPAPSTQQFLSNFNDAWANRQIMKDVTDTVLENIENVYKENSPSFIYFVTLYNIFHEFLEDINEDVLPNEATGFKQSVIWNLLYNYQKDAALAIINKLEKYNGCILADSVGLGKTYTALSVIKYYENKNKNVLVLCPKKLNDNWMTYRSNYATNPLVADRLRYDVLFHTDLSRTHGESNGLDLQQINWSNYDLIVIDESHNFRNGGRVDDDIEETDRRENRYEKLLNNVIRSGVRTKVLMLSATPVNNRFNDLKNQLQLAYEGNVDLINEKLGFDRSIDDIFRSAQAVYNQWSRLPNEERTTQALQEMLDFDFFELLDAVTIARSRSHIQRYYNTSDIGKFPERLRPISQRPDLTDLDDAATYREIAECLDTLILGIYTPSSYILPSRLSLYEGNGGRHVGLSVRGREMGIRKLMAINMLKRLESSVHAFRLTFGKVKEQVEAALERIAEYERTGNKNMTISLVDVESELDAEDSETDIFGTEARVSIRISDMDWKSWQRDLKADLDVLNHVDSRTESITPQHDSKLQLLFNNLRDKTANPINPGNKKVLVFTAFSDTAEYLYQELSQMVLGLNIGLITGNRATSTLRNFRNDFNNVLTLFSPVSKKRQAVMPNETRNIDILIATDCISEGQNLQDCDYLINYDIHWNPVRIIQRFGRIDRIGSTNDYIQLVNYWPNIELDDYIRLKGRVESRMKATVLTSTGDDDLLSENERGDLEYRRRQLERLQNEVVDIEEMDTGINIMDLGLNEFRQDLIEYMKHHHDVEHTPNGLSAVVGSSANIKPGVVFILKNRNNEVNIERKNQLHPFYMVHLADDGSVVCNHLQPKKLLDSLRASCKETTEPIPELYREFNSQTNDGRDMGHYSELLQRAIQSIIEIRTESDIDSLFSVGETTALRSEIRGLDDFELICFLVIK